MHVPLRFDRSRRLLRFRPRAEAAGICFALLLLAVFVFGPAAQAAPSPNRSPGQPTPQASSPSAGNQTPRNAAPASADPADPAPSLAAPAAETTPPAPVAPPLPDPRPENSAARTEQSTPRAAKPISALPSGPSLVAHPEGLSLTPFLRILADPTDSLTAADVTKVKPDTFQPFTGIHPFGQDRKQTGTIWLYFTMSPSRVAASSDDGQGAEDDGPEYAMLDLGDQIPSLSQVWMRPGGKGLPREIRPGEAGLYSLTALAGGGEVFIRLPGQPGLWFTPSLRALSDSLKSPERRIHPLGMAALTVLLMLCVVRSITERGDGRIWAAIFAGSALMQAFWGVPATPGGSVSPTDIPGILAAGIALMLLPHVGRNIMRTRETSPGADVLLLVLALPGAAMALLPLLPGQAWLARLVPLWPLGAALPLFPALYLLGRKIPGSSLFSLACLAMTGGTLLAMWGMNGALAPLWGQGPLLGITLATLLLAAAPRSAYADNRAPVRARQDPSFEPIPTLHQETILTGNNLNSALRLEEALRAPLDALLREACALDQTLGGSEGREKGQNTLSPGRPFAPSLADKLPPPPLNERDARLARRHADNLVAASRELSALVTDIPRTAIGAARPSGVRRIFELRRLVTDSFDTVRAEAEDKGLGLSWYIAPQLGNMYRGDSDRLRFILSMLLADAVRATERGVVSLRVRRSDVSANPGHLQFSVSDTGEGTPPLRRSSLLLARAWELAADHRGELFVDGTPYGVDITFSMDCAALTDDGTAELPRPPKNLFDRPAPAAPNPRLVILASDIPLNRQLLAWHLEGQGQDIWEARDAEEAAALYAHTPAGLVVFDGNLPEDSVVTSIAAIRVLEGESQLSAVPFLALAVDEAQAERLHQAGCDHSLPLPVIRGEFRAMALHLASPSGLRPQPSITPRRAPAVFKRTEPTLMSGRASENNTPVQGTSHQQNSLAETALPVPENRPYQETQILSLTREERPVFPHSVGEPKPVPRTASTPVPEDRAAATPPTPSPASSAAPVDAQASATTKIPPASHQKMAFTDPKPARPEPEAAPLRTPVQEPRVKTDETEGKPASPAAPTAMTGLNIPPPKKRWAWLSSMLKPTPRVAEMPDEEPVRMGGEWVGTPMPVGSSAPSAVAENPAPPQEQSVPPNLFSAELPLTPWLTKTQTDPEESVGEPMPVLSAKSEPEPEAANVAPEATAERPKNTPEAPVLADILEGMPQDSIQEFDPQIRPKPEYDVDNEENALSEPLPHAAATTEYSSLPVTEEADSPALSRGVLHDMPPAITEVRPEPAFGAEPEEISPNAVRVASMTFILPDAVPEQNFAAVSTQEGTKAAETPSPASLEAIEPPAAGEPRGDGTSDETAKETNEDANAPATDHKAAVPPVLETASSELPDFSILLAPQVPLSPAAATVAPVPPAAATVAPIIAADILPDPAKDKPQNTPQSSAPAEEENVARRELADRPTNKSRRRKNRMEELPFLSLDPNYIPPGSTSPEGTSDAAPLALALDNPGGLDLELASGPVHAGYGGYPDLPEAESVSEDVIVDLTEAEMLDSPLLQQVPDLLPSLDSALERAELALDKQDTWGLANAAGRMADRAAAFGLHGLSDLALCMREAAEAHDFEAAAQLLPDLRAEVARQRGE